MKKYLLFSFLGVAIIFLISSCGQKSPTAQTLSYQDALEFAQFQEWKAMQEKQEAQLYAANAAPKATRRYSAAKTVNMNSSSTHEAKAPVRKKWSKAAKYGVIGGGGGAVLGAVIHKKNRVAGGVVGAVLGGGLGYVIGRSQDKKEGRY